MQKRHNDGYKNISKKELYKKLSNLLPQDLKKLNINNNEIEYIKNKLLNDKLGLVLNYDEIDEVLDENYFGLEEKQELHINPKAENNNLIIEGDNYYGLKALKVSGIKVDIIYIDPPYNTGNKDFIYNDDFSTQVAKEVNTDDPHKHSKWLSFMKRRLEIAKDLLTDDGVIFVSIDDHEQAYLKILMDEIFGEENFVTDIIWVRNPGGESDNSHIANTKDFILFYSKDKRSISINHSLKEQNILDFKKINNEVYKKGSMLEKSGENDRLIDRKNLGYVVYYNKKLNKIIIKHDYNLNLINEKTTIDNKIYTFNTDLINSGYLAIIPRFIKNTYGRWRIGPSKLEKLFNDKLIIFDTNKNEEIRMYEKVIFSYDDPYKKEKPKDFISFTTNSNGTNQLKKIFNGNSPFSKPKPAELISYLINLCSTKNSSILDFFAGSGTTGQAVMELNEEDNGNRRFILITNNENNIARNICRERIHRVILGKGSNNETIAWEYSEDKKSLFNNSVKYLIVKPIHQENGEYEDINKMKDIYKNEFNKILSIKDFI